MTEYYLVALRARGVEVATALEAGIIDREDFEHQVYVTAQRCSLFSYAVKDFYDLRISCLTADKSHADIILTRQPACSVDELMRRRLRVIGARPAEEMKDRVDFPRARG